MNELIKIKCIDGEVTLTNYDANRLNYMKLENDINYISIEKHILMQILYHSQFKFNIGGYIDFFNIYCKKGEPEMIYKKKDIEISKQKLKIAAEKLKELNAKGIKKIEVIKKLNNITTKDLNDFLNFRDGNKTALDDVLKNIKKLYKINDTQIKAFLNDTTEHLICIICMDRKINISFLCGHTCCIQCGLTIVKCHICRKDTNEEYINIYI